MSFARNRHGTFYGDYADVHGNTCHGEFQPHDLVRDEGRLLSWEKSLRKLRLVKPWFLNGLLPVREKRVFEAMCDLALLEEPVTYRTAGMRAGYLDKRVAAQITNGTISSGRMGLFYKLRVVLRLPVSEIKRLWYLDEETRRRELKRIFREWNK